MPIWTMPRGTSFIERKICYDSSVVDHSCKLLKAEHRSIVLLHRNERSFTMAAGAKSLTIPEGAYTFAFYWLDRPYNLYIWKDRQGNGLGSYFNIVRNTYVTEQAVIFEDMIIDLLVLPGGEVYVLDEDELPEPLDRFEGGSVQRSLSSLVKEMEHILQDSTSEAERLIREDESILGPALR